MRLSRFSAFLITFVVPFAAAANDHSAVPQMLRTLKPRHIGPATMSGRITDLAVYDKAPRIMYVASASGGLWKTVNHGTTWKPVFERERTIALGAVAVDQNNSNHVWVGGGEANPRNSVSWGDGVYRSTDGGGTWQHMGLAETWHIGRIVIDPRDGNVVYVAALGKFWAANPERGVFKTTDGGKTWRKILYFDDNTGAVDLVVDPENPDRLYAAMWEVRRDAFSGGNPAVQTGPKAGLYVTSDGGDSWTKLRRGLPDRPVGRCGITVSASDPRILYAVVQTDKTAVTVQGQGPNGKLDASHGGIFRSDNRGLTWTHVNSLCPRPFYYGQIRVDPKNPKRVYVLGINLHVSSNGGKSFTKNNLARGTHADYHALWIDPRDSHHLVLGSDGGLNFSYDMGQHWEYLKNLPLAQFYAVGLDQRTPYRVYGGLQDNGTWFAPSATRDKNGITVADWVKVLGYDGYHCQIDPDDPDTVYAEGQYGILRRLNVRTWDTVDIKPRLKTKDYSSNIDPRPADGAAEFRFNWSSPILLSPHNPKTVFFGGNVLFRSDNRGDTWTIISPDLTRGPPGPSSHRGHTITTIAESPLKQGLIYAGTDDGNVFVTQDGGRRWLNVTDRFPDAPRDRCVTRLECSTAHAGVVYAAFDRHRNDDQRPYLYKSNDYGNTWASLVNDLPADGPIHVVREDPRNPELLYVGTEFGLFMSLSGGRTWHKVPLLPTVPVHDLVVHPRDRELVIATHGRGIYIMDVAPLQELAGARQQDRLIYLCDVRPAQAYRRVPLTSLDIRNYAGENPPYGATFSVFFAQPQTNVPVLTIENQKGRVMAELAVAPFAGLQQVRWNLNRKDFPADEYDPVPSGDYTATLRVGNVALRKTFNVDAEE